MTILPDSAIRELIENRAIASALPFDEDQIQPASLDLRLGEKAWRIRTSFLPGPDSTVEGKSSNLLGNRVLREIDLTEGTILETGCVYLAPLLERIALPKKISASANPKSSTGRLDIFTRVLADRAQAFDQIEAGYEGPLYLEISPSTFPIKVKTGSRLSQIRFRSGSSKLTEKTLRDLQREQTLIDSKSPDIHDRGIGLSVNLPAGELSGYRAKHHNDVIDVDRKAACDILDFWEPISLRPSEGLILDPGEFYILASREAVRVPPLYAAEMAPFNHLVGEFRVHYAGFFDPGFGYESPARAVLEVRSHEVPFVLEHGQLIGRLVYERMAKQPDGLYGAKDSGSNYQGQGLRLSKHFRQD